MKRLIHGLLCRFLALRRDEHGYAVMATLAIFLFLFVLCAAVYAVGETIHERIKIQNACDAAAYSAAVVQADGLSRMACVNRAMSWTYVQMSNRQMDYITYRWLWLTCKRFGEDRDNAHGFADHMNLVCDKELGFWAIVEVAVSGILDMWLKYPCDTGNHRPEHSDGHPWWAGQEGTDINLISLNKFPAIKGTTTYDNLSSVRSALGTIFDLGGDSGSANLLGRLIDYDKNNIQQMNKALARINYEMTRSMRETAENVLKASLADNRLETQTSLADYWVSIQIPYARNPYPDDEIVTNRRVVVNSYFSPLRNTEPDERQFLQMQTTDLADKPLASFFPKLLLGNTSTAFGVDQWFVRGKGVYNKEDGERTGAVPAGTVRSEGELGLQRVYKDTELNESHAGFELADLKTVKEVFRGNHLMNLTALATTGIQAFKQFIGGGGSLESEDDDADDDPDDDGSELDDSKNPDEVRAKLVAEKESLERRRDEVDASRTETAAKITKLKRDLANLGPNEDKSALENELNYQKAVFEAQTKEYDNLTTQINDTQKAIDDLDEEVRKSGGDASSPKADGSKGDDKEHSGGSYGESKPGSGLGSFVSGLFDSILTYLGDRLLDIQPSCTHVHAENDFTPPMCEKAKERTGLVSQYRWASCKWYCMTTGKAWLYSMIWNHQRIWCDREKHTFKKILRHKFKARGIGHFGFPKWYCARKPDQPLETGWGLLDKVLHRFPPFPVPTAHMTNYNVKVSHGYMKTPFDLQGFIEPFRPLFKDEDGSSNGFHRDEYESCAQFMDGSFNFWKGRDSYAGIIRGHARIYGDDKEIFDSRYIGAKCKPWILNEKFFGGEGSIIVGAARRFSNPFSQLFGFFGSEKALADYDKSVLSAFKIPKDNYMWTMSAARAGVRHRRRNCKFDKDRMYQITYDPTPDAITLHYQGGKPVIYDHGVSAWRFDPMQDNMVEKDLAKGNFNPLIWDGCVCRTENKERFRAIWNLCESDWDATLLPLRYSCVGASLYLPTASGRDRRIFLQETIRDRRNMVDTAYKNDLDGIGAGTNWVWFVTSGAESLEPSANPFIGLWWKLATEEYFNVLDFEWRQSMQFLPTANKLPTESDNAAAWRYWNLLQQNRIL